MNRYLARGSVAIALSCLLSVGCRSDVSSSAAPERTSSEPLRAAITRVDYQPWPTTVRAQGSLIADETTIVGAEVPGRVAEVGVDLGDEVQVGTPLVALDRREFQLRVAQVQAQLAQTRVAIGLKPEAPLEQLEPTNSPPVREARTLLDDSAARRQRLQRLRDQSVVSQEEYESALAAEQVAEARYASALNTVNEKIAQLGVLNTDLALAQQQLDDAVTVAPFAGLVQKRHVAVGAYVQVGQPLVTLVRTGVLRFHGTVPERVAQRIAIGQRVTLRLESIPQPCQVQVSRVSPAIDDASRALVFEANVENQDGRIRSGLFAEAELLIDPHARSLVVPATAITEFAGVEKVWKVVEGTAREQAVQTGQHRGDWVEILAGLAEGDEVLTDARHGRVAQVEPVASTTETSYATAQSRSSLPPGTP